MEEDAASGAGGTASAGCSTARLTLATAAVMLLLVLKMEEAEEMLVTLNTLYEREHELDELEVVVLLLEMMLLLLLMLVRDVEKEDVLTLDEVDSTAEAVGTGLGRKLSLVCLSLRWRPAGHFERQYYAGHLHSISSLCLTESSNHEVVGICLVVGDLRFVREVCP